MEYATTQIPTYPCGQIGFLCCSKTDGKTPDSMAKPVRAVPADMNNAYYHSALHEASFVLPNFMVKLIAGVKAEKVEPAAEAAATAAAPAAK